MNTLLNVYEKFPHMPFSSERVKLHDHDFDIPQVILVLFTQLFIFFLTNH